MLILFILLTNICVNHRSVFLLPELQLSLDTELVEKQLVKEKFALNEASFNSSSLIYVLQTIL